MGTQETDIHSSISSPAFISPLFLCLPVFCHKGCKVQGAWCRQGGKARSSAGAGVFFLLVQRCQRIVGFSVHILGSLGEEGQSPDCSSGSGFKAGCPGP